MANVAGVSQLLETVGVPANQSASASPVPEYSFANVMHQANTDAGVPLVPVEQNVQPKAQGTRSETGESTGKHDEQTPTQASGPVTPSPAAIKPAPAVARPLTSLRYTPANMLSAMPVSVGANAVISARTAPDTPAAAPTVPSTAQPRSQASSGVTPSAGVPAVSAAAVRTASTTNKGMPEQVATLDGKPLDLSVPTAVASTVSVDLAKLAAKPGVSTAQAQAHSVTKQDAILQDAVPTAAGPVVAPVLSVAAPASVSPPVLVVSPTPLMPVADTSAAVIVPAIAVPSVKASSVSSAAVAKNLEQSSASPTAQPIAPSILASASAGLPMQAAIISAQGSAATFKQSLSAIPTESAPATTLTMTAAAPDKVEHPLSALIGKQPPIAALQPDTATTIVPHALSASPSKTASAPALTAATQASATQPLAGAALPVSILAALPQNTSQPVPQTPVPLKTAGKPSLSADASRQAASTASLATSPATASQALQPSPSTTASTSTASSDVKAVPHPSTVAESAPTPAQALDGAALVAAPFAVAHMPVAVTALSNPGGPVLATAVTAASSATSAISAMTDPLQHTTLSSTPTTLEVGVASGTHGWLKIRAELNASGTVDASLTGINAAATGKLHNDLPALSSFLQDERVAFGSLNVSAPGAAASALHATVASTLEPTSSFTRSAAEGVGATGTAVASDAGTAGGRAPQQQAPENSPAVTIPREDDGVAAAITAPVPAGLSALYGEGNDMVGSGALSDSGGGSWLNVRV